MRLVLMKKFHFSTMKTEQQFCKIFNDMILWPNIVPDCCILMIDYVSPKIAFRWYFSNRLVHIPQSFVYYRVK